jgi:hypothetical protein
MAWRKIAAEASPPTIKSIVENPRGTIPSRNAKKPRCFMKIPPLGIYAGSLYGWAREIGVLRKNR